MKKPTVFLCYSHQDTRWKDRLLSHLRVLERQTKFDIWDASDIQTGKDNPNEDYQQHSSNKNYIRYSR
jgi:hypothetical protein